MTDKMYDTIKTIALLIVPCLALASTLVNVWGIANADVWAATFAALDVFVGAVVTVAKKLYDERHKDEKAAG